jgi:hypothetical protein
MVKLLLFGVLFLNLNLCFAKLANVPDQEIYNRVAAETDTAFIGRVLRVKIINDGLVYENGNTLPIGIMEQEVLKVYRGKISKGDKVLVCTWFDHADFPFGPSIGTEGIIFGIKVDNRVLLPAILRYFNGVPKNESIIYKALKIKQKYIADRVDVLATYFVNSKLTRNACNEPVTWP